MKCAVQRFGDDRFCSDDFVGFALTDKMDDTEPLPGHGSMIEEPA